MWCMNLFGNVARNPMNIVMEQENVLPKAVHCNHNTLTALHITRSKDLLAECIQCTADVM